MSRLITIQNYEDRLFHNDLEKGEFERIHFLMNAETTRFVNDTQPPQKPFERKHKGELVMIGGILTFSLYPPIEYPIKTTLD